MTPAGQHNDSMAWGRHQYCSLSRFSRRHSDRWPPGGRGERGEVGPLSSRRLRGAILWKNWKHHATGNDAPDLNRYRHVPHGATVRVSTRTFAERSVVRDTEGRFTAGAGVLSNVRERCSGVASDVEKRMTAYLENSKKVIWNFVRPYTPNPRHLLPLNYEILISDRSENNLFCTRSVWMS